MVGTTVALFYGGIVVWLLRSLLREVPWTKFGRFFFFFLSYSIPFALLWRAS